MEYLSNRAYTRGVTDNMRYSRQRMRTIRALVPEDDEEGRLSYYLDIMKYHTNWKMLTLPSEWANMTYHKASPLKGFEFKDEVGPQPMPDCGNAEGEKAIPPEQEDCLVDLLSFLQQSGKEALFIVSPYGESLEEQQMYNYMEEIVSSYGYSFLNMNDHYREIGIIFEEDFADYGSHTNAIGAEKCSDFLRAYLQERYSFTDKRGQEKYRSWDAAYELWKLEMEEARETILDRIARGEYAQIEDAQ